MHPTQRLLPLFLLVPTLAGAEVTPAAGGWDVGKFTKDITWDTTAAAALKGRGIVLNGAVLSFEKTKELTVRNAISGNGSLRIVNSKLTLAGSNTYTGGTQIIGEGPVAVAHNAAFGTGPVTLGDVPGSGQIALHAAGERTLANAFEIRAQRWIIDSPKGHGGATGSLTIQGDVLFNQGGVKDIYCNHPLVLTGSVSSRGGLTKNGGYNLTLAGRAAYQGETKVVGGALTVNGALASPANLTVASGGTLTGGGTITSPVSVRSGGRLIPGNNAAGTLRTGALTLESGASLLLQLGMPADGSNTQVAVTGNLTIDGEIHLTAKTGFTSGTYTLATFSGGLGGKGLGKITTPLGYLAQMILTTPGKLQVRLLAASALAPANHLMRPFADAVRLTWVAPPGVVAYDLYLGTDESAVSQATPASAGIYQGRLQDPEFMARGCASGTTTYWRVDYQLADGAVFKGVPWDFTQVVEQDLMMDTWVATDGLNRVLPDQTLAGPPRRDRPIAIFYFLWHNKGGLGNDGPRDVTQEIARLKGYTNPKRPWDDHPRWMEGANARSWYWGEPEDGYYAADDEWVIRRHLTLLTAAGVDILAFDTTNGSPQRYQISIIKIADTIRKMRKEGMKIDLKFLFLTHGGIGGSPATITWLYDHFYRPGLYPEMWLMWGGKPAIVGYPDGAGPGDSPVSEEVRGFFTFRTGWANVGKTPVRNEWQWIDTPSPQNYGYSSRADIPEQVPVACGGWCNGNLGRSNSNRVQPGYDKFHLTPARTEGQGLFFSEQIHYGLKLDPQLWFITGWNEWWAGAWTAPAKGGGYRILDNFPEIGERYFVDNYNVEYSRDIEPMKGGFGDNYYYQMVAANRLRKGVRTTPPATPPVTITGGDAAAFANVGPTYFDAPDETLARDWGGTFGNLPNYTNTTGRNDFRVLKVARDADQLYFYAQTKAAITPAGDPNWMLLLVDADQNHATGWEGYDYVINFGGSGVVQRLSGTTWAPVRAGTAAVKVTGNQMVLSVPRALLGLAADPLKLDFHWVDNLTKPGDLADFGSSGDSAPERRFNYRYATAPDKGVALFQDDFEKGQKPSWGATFTSGSRWKISSTLPHAGMQCLLGTGSDDPAASGMLVQRIDTSGLTSLRVAFHYKLADVKDADHLTLSYRNVNGSWDPIRELGRDAFHPAGQAWGYDEAQDVWLYFNDQCPNSGKSAGYFHPDFALKIEISGLHATQSIALDDLQVTGTLPSPRP